MSQLVRVNTSEREGRTTGKESPGPDWTIMDATDVFVTLIWMDPGMDAHSFPYFPTLLIPRFESRWC